MSERLRSVLKSPYLYYAALALLITAPLLRGGYLLLLDFALIKNVQVQWWPTVVQPGPVNSAPFVSVLWLLVKLGWIAGPIVVFSVFFAMGASMHRAVTTLWQVPTPAALFAGTLYMVNPFTYDRLMAGHLLFLAAYAIAPLVVVAAVRCAQDPSKATGLRWGLATTAIAWTSVHYLVIQFVLVVPLALLHRAFRTRRGIGAAAWASAVFLVLNVWWIIGVFVQNPGANITERDVGVYMTRPEGPAVVGNVAALYGFWRHEFTLPKDGVQAWWLIALPLGALVLVGIRHALRDAQRRLLAIALVAVIPVAIVIASGTSWGPTKGVFLWLFENVPGFALFREPQKWVGLLPLSYAMLGAVGVERVPARERADRRRYVTAVVTIAAVMVYGNTLLWNWDRLTPVRFPSDWEKVEQIVAKEGGTMLFLPWHLYMTFDFTGRRVVNPAPYYFSVPVISGDNVEVPGIRTQSRDVRSRMVEEALAARDGGGFNSVMQGLCVEWVFIAGEGDAKDYDWVKMIDGLSTKFSGAQLSVYRLDPRNRCPV